MKRFLVTVLVVGVVVAVLAVLGAGPAAKWALETLGTQAMGAPVRCVGVELSLVHGAATIRDLSVGDPASAEGNLLTARAVTADLALRELLAGRVIVDRAELESPVLNIHRAKDGTINIEYTGARRPPLPETPGVEAGDLTGRAEEVARRAQEEDWAGRIREAWEGAQRREAAAAAGGAAGGGAGAAPSEGPALVVRSLALKDAVVHFTDETATEPLPRLVAVTGQVLNLSDAPAAWGQPVEANLSGRVDDENGGRIALEARYDYRQGVLLTQTYALRTEGVEMARLAAFFGRSSAVDLRKGKATSDVKGVMRDGQMDFQVVSDLTGVEVAAKPGVKRLAGLKAEDVVRGVNAVKDFHIAFGVKGSPGSPRFEWGDEIARIITQGGVDAAKAAAMDAAEEAADDAARRASEAADRALGDAVPPGQGGEVVDEAKDRLRRGVGGLFGKDK